MPYQTKNFVNKEWCLSPFFLQNDNEEGKENIRNLRGRRGMN